MIDLVWGGGGLDRRWVLGAHRRVRMERSGAGLRWVARRGRRAARPLAASTGFGSIGICTAVRHIRIGGDDSYS